MYYFAGSENKKSKTVNERDERKQTMKRITELKEKIGWWL
jgi:hypothetical protein